MSVLRLALSNQCPLNCAACYVPRHTSEGSVIASSELVSKLIANAADEGFDTVAIGGGEPLFTMPITLHAITQASKAGMASAVTTSGYRMSDDTLKKLEMAGLDHVQLSLGRGRVNLTSAYNFMIEAQRRCSFGINLLLSPGIVSFLPALVEKFDADRVDQITLLLPKGGRVARFTDTDFMRYYAILKLVKPKHMALRIDCATQQILTGGCAPKGCSVFPDGTVSRCAFGCGPRVMWSGSLLDAMAGDSHICNEGGKVLNRITERQEKCPEAATE